MNHLVPRVVLESTHEKALEIVILEQGQANARAN
jgi:uncharacterized protein (DUF2237 family)